MLGDEEGRERRGEKDRAEAAGTGQVRRWERGAFKALTTPELALGPHEKPPSLLWIAQPGNSVQQLLLFLHVIIPMRLLQVFF